MAHYGKHSPEYKAKIVIEVLLGNETPSEIGAREGLSPKMIGNWKREFLANAYRAFSVTKDEKKALEAADEAALRERTLMAKIGQLTYELDWLKKKYDDPDEPENRTNRRKRA